jgi:outer membrane protein
MKLRLAAASLLLAMVHGSAQAPAPSPVETRAKANPQLRTPDPSGLHFTLKQAEDYALANHPEIAAANLTADAVRQQIREARSQFFPQVYAESNSVEAPRPEGMRLSAGPGLSNSNVFSRQSDGVTVSQLLFDFGHTYDLTESAHFRAAAATNRASVVRAVVVLQVDRAYFDLLKANAVLDVATRTVDARQKAFDQISVLTKNQLKSTLDANFAQVNLSEAKLLLIQARNGINDAEAELSTALGFPEAQHFVLTEQPLDMNVAPAVEPLILEAWNQRPELGALHNDEEAAQRFAQAQDAARYPKVTALGAAGVNPVANDKDFARTYYMAGVNVEVPVFTGGNLDAHAKEAHLLADAAIKNLVDAQNTISRDVRVAWLDLNTARERIGVTAELVQTAQEEVRLADARYRLGTSSIVELTQAELNYTEAQLQDASARYDYQGGRALLNFTIAGSF